MSSFCDTTSHRVSGESLFLLRLVHAFGFTRRKSTAFGAACWAAQPRPCRARHPCHLTELLITDELRTRVLRDGFPKEVQVMLSAMRSTIRLAASQAIEKISYQIPTFYLNGNLVHFAAFKNHMKLIGKIVKVRVSESLRKTGKRQEEAQ